MNLIQASAQAPAATIIQPTDVPKLYPYHL